MGSQPGSLTETGSVNYTERLAKHEGHWWKRLFDVQAPYRWNLQRLRLGFVLDIGCGLGRNLINLGGNGVGVDHNEHSVGVARERGLRAFTSNEFGLSEFNRPASFDTLLVSHVLEHMDEVSGGQLLATYLPLLKTGGSVVLITPQEAGQRSDPTHIRSVDFAALTRLLLAQGLKVSRLYSFPFPSWVGRFFLYNEFIAVAKKPAELGEVAP